MGKTAKRHAVLIVDDEPSILKALSRLLHEEDYSTVTSDTYEDAVALLSEQTFAVVISDFCMPNVSGGDLLGIVKAKSPRTMRVMLSGSASSGSVPATIANDILHCQFFLAKPWNDEELLRVIRDCIARYEAAEQVSQT